MLKSRGEAFANKHLQRNHDLKALAETSARINRVLYVNESCKPEVGVVKKKSGKLCYV